jgi:hypothetical protein
LFQSYETNYREQGAQVFKKFFGCMYAGRWVLGSTPEQKAVCDVIDKKNKWKWSKGGEAVVAPDIQAIERVEFVKWVQLDCNNDSGMQRGVEKIYASQWHNRPKFDLLRIDNGEYLLLKGLCLFDSKVFGIGVVPENLNLTKLPYHYRWPTLLVRSDAPLTVMELDIKSVHPVMALDDLRNDDTFWREAKARPQDRIIFHNIFATHGEFRNPWELQDWSKGGNGDEWWNEEK